MKTAYIGIGSNLGDARKNCLDAVDRVGKIPGCSILGLSNLYLTEPVGVEGQNWYANGVVSISTSLSARSLLESLLAIEADMGRIRKERWESRVIDLDLLFFGQDIIKEENLRVPHPFMHERRFVIAPMVDLSPDFIHPFLGKSMIELLNAVSEDGQTVKRLEDR